MGRQSSDAGMKVEIPSKKKVEEKPRMSEAEMAELRAREEQERILAELPAAKVSHGGATWEIEVCLSLLINTEAKVVGTAGKPLQGNASAPAEHLPRAECCQTRRGGTCGCGGGTDRGGGEEEGG